MKLGIPMLVVGVLMLMASVPLSILSILGGFTQITQGRVSGGVSGYVLIAGVIIGLLLTGIGAVRVFKQ
jgi:hypothetical protein